MITSQNGIDLIKKFEGVRLKAYKDAVGVWTIGYGHTKGVKQGQTITAVQAESLLKEDLAKFEDHVTGYNAIYGFNQNEFDALVSFAFNVGSISQLTNNGKRTRYQIEQKWSKYCNAGGKQLTGLVTRRKAELKLFKTAVSVNELNPYSEPKTNIKLNSKGIGVKWVQYQLNLFGYGLTIDGVAGNKTINAVKDFQANHNLTTDGVVGKATRSALKEV